MNQQSYTDEQLKQAQEKVKNRAPLFIGLAIGILAFMVISFVGIFALIFLFL